MKIWFQSGAPLAKEGATSGYERSLKEHVQKIARPGTVVDVYGIDSNPPGRELYFTTQHLVTSCIIKNAIRAEAEGYDAFAVVCTLDQGFHEVREMVDIPVVFVMESCMHMACQLAPKFAFLTHNDALLLRLKSLAMKYGLTERMAPGGCTNFSSEDYGRFFDNPEPYVRALTEEGRRIIKQGANVLLLSGNAINMMMLDQNVREIDGVPILDVCGTTVKIAELMVDLAIVHTIRSTNGLFSRPSNSERLQLRTILGLDNEGRTASKIDG